MTPKPQRPVARPQTGSSSGSNRSNQSRQSQSNSPSDSSDYIATTMTEKITSIQGLGLSKYKLRELVNDTEKFGSALAAYQLKTTQLRKFLDAVNRLKAKQDATQHQQLTQNTKDELQVLRYQLAYAARPLNNKPSPVKPLKKVLEKAIEEVKTGEDFQRFVQLIESIVAYHKAAGGKD